jgi:hypothetical protein
MNCFNLLLRVLENTWIDSKLFGFGIIRLLSANIAKTLSSRYNVNPSGG